ncbi:DUF262 domain-containing protein [Prevotella sp.]|uniref:DUF262 domain-containing protein n=1 Tax=Prevotella sp. TaxID=59823 RepID=UPI003DA2E794
MCKTNIDKPIYQDLIGLKGKTFYIPSQQRGYKWTPRDIRLLLDDLLEFANDLGDAKIYCLQPLSVIKKDEKNYEVLDGQQRLTSLYLISKGFGGPEPYDFNFESDSDNSRMNFMRCCEKEISKNKEKKLAIDLYHIHKAFQAVNKWIEDHPSDVNNVKKLIYGENTRKSVKFIWYLIDADSSDENAKHKAFRNLNDGKIELTNSDLIKALLLNDGNACKEFNVSLVAAQFDEMEQKLKNDSFWFMLQNDEPLYINCRMDLIFNLSEGIEQKLYDKYNTASFERFSEDSSPIVLIKKWNHVRDIYLRLVDFFEDIESYHYIGYLTYCYSSSELFKWIKIRSDNTKSVLIEILKEEISQTLPDRSLKELSYDSSKTDLRRVFLIHNIETILTDYREKHKNMNLQLNNSYQRFPFELLYQQVWQIEHIASQTDNILQDSGSQNDWLKSSLSDFSDVFEKGNIKDLKKMYELKMNDTKDSRIEAFKNLYNAILETLDDELEEQKIDNKNGIGNLVLLDSKTNQGYHNALFPAKRKWVIDNAKRFYYPPCTEKVFLKFYNTTSAIKTCAWTRDDSEAYLRDLDEKISIYR